ncbi:MAG: T9SS C-terminal target domain-containing protein [Ignavibacteriales bacterium]|nr:MAG: T9SS C-terminal target domain-containing protein [Ignavibacteriales bacterium]
MKKYFIVVFLSILNLLLSATNKTHLNNSDNEIIILASSVTTAEWRNSLGLTAITQADACDNVRIYIRTSGYSSGSKFTAKIYEYDATGNDYMGEVSITINLLGTGYATWTAPWINDISASTIRQMNGFDVAANNPSYIFQVYEEGSSTLLITSSALQVYDNDLPGTVVLNQPADKADYKQTSYSVDFSWQAISEENCQSAISFYRIEVSKVSSFNPLEWSSELNGTNISHQFNKGIYYWRVAAKDITGNPADFSNANWSEVRGFKIGESKIQTRINPESITDAECKRECAVKLSAILEYFDQWDLQWLPLTNKIIGFQVFVNGEWRNITDDVSLTEQITNDEGFGSVYYIPLRDIPLGNYLIRYLFLGDESYNECSDTVDFVILKSKSEAIRLVYPSVATSYKTPIILIHGDYAEMSSVNCAWDTLLSFINKNQILFNNYDVYVWKQDTSIPIGFNGNTGSAQELSEFIQPVLSSHPGRKVILVGHSRGGLVSRSYMNYNNQGDNVLGLVALGTPHHGAPMAVLDWSFMVLNNQYGSLATSLFDESQYEIMRMGDLNLTWDNMDSVIINTITRDFNSAISKNGRLTLTERDFNRLSTSGDTTITYSENIKNYFGNLTDLNKNEKYYNKIITYGAYDNYLGDNGNLIALLTSLPTLLNIGEGEVEVSSLHNPIMFLTQLLTTYDDGYTTRNVNFNANDGLVPLQSALFLDISGGISFAKLNSNLISLENVNERKLVKRQRIFNNANSIYDHIHLIDISTRNNYWQTLVNDINSFYEFNISSPDSGNQWLVGENKTITWSSQNVYGNVNILLSTDNGLNFNYSLASNTPNDNVELVTVPDLISSACKLKIVLSDDTSKYAVSNGVFSISKSERKKGDFDNNGRVQAIDASLILQSVVGLVNKPEPGTDDSLACDIDRNGMIGAFDAYLILYFIVHGEYPENIEPKTTLSNSLCFGKIYVDGDIIRIPVEIKQPDNISSVKMSLNIDEKYYAFEKIVSSLPDDWLFAYNTRNSSLNIAFTGFSKMKEGVIYEILLKMRTKSASYSFEGDGIINDKSEIKITGNEIKLIPGNFELYQNYPNPFNPVTKIKFTLPNVETSYMTSLRIYNILGKEIITLINEELPAGEYEVEVDGNSLSSGIYFYRLMYNSFSSSKKMVLTK